MQQRNSNFELLRIICIFGIISMHTFGNFANKSTGVNLMILTLINSVFNTCVSCFILISGYFGVKSNAKKLLSLDLRIIFFSVSTTLVLSIWSNNFTIRDLIPSIIPIISRKYWFISCYFVLVIFSGYLNKIPERLARKSFELLLFLMLLIFSVIPSFFIFDLMIDGGKGLVNMILIYLVGRYIKLYWTENYSISKILFSILFLLSTVFFLNYFSSIFTGHIINLFSRDSSILIISSAIAIFMLFRELNFKSRIINFIASSVLMIYVLEGFVRIVINYFIDISCYLDKWYFSLILFLYIILVIVVCFIIDVVRNYTIGRLELTISDFVIKNVHALKVSIRPVRKKLNIMLYNFFSVKNGI